MSAVDIIDGRGYILNVEFGGGKDGVDGKDGRDGVAPDLQIGTVKESEDDQPHVTISDEGDGKLSLNFDLVSGQDGQNGEDGGIYIPSVSQEGVISWIAPEGQNPPQAVSIKGEDGATFTPTVSIGGEISWINDKNLENPDTRNIRGPKGEKGDPFTIYKVYNSKAEMDADYSNPDVPMGAFVCITNSVDQSENARLYVKGTQEYTFITDLSGATGMQGVPGIGIGRVGLMEEQHSPLYKEYGVWSDQTPEVLLGTFNLPVGEDGQQGTDGVGVKSIVQTTTSHEDDGVNVVTVTLTDGNTSTFNVENGSKGSTGAQGPAGQNGKDGQDGVGINDITVEQSTFDGQANVVTVHLSDDTTKTFNVYNGHTGATGTAGTLNTNNTSAAIPTSESMSGNISLHKISKTGNYNDLLNKPTIPAAANNSLITIQKNGSTVNTFTLNQSSPKTVNIPIPTTVAELSDASNYALRSSLATVATSGSYTDLSNRPVIGNAELKIQSVDNTTPETYTEIGKFHANAASPETITLSKVARTGNYSDLKNIQQSDWGQGNSDAIDFIKNKPILSDVATSGNYYDLINRPVQGVYYSSVDDLESVNSWPQCHTIVMKRVATFSNLGASNNACVVCKYGTGNNAIKYIPLGANRTYLLEVSVHWQMLYKPKDESGSTYVRPIPGNHSGSITLVSATTDSNGSVIQDSIRFANSVEHTKTAPNSIEFSSETVSTTYESRLIDFGAIEDAAYRHFTIWNYDDDVNLLDSEYVPLSAPKANKSVIIFGNNGNGKNVVAIGVITGTGSLDTEGAGFAIAASVRVLASDSITARYTPGVDCEVLSIN